MPENRTKESLRAAITTARKTLTLAESARQDDARDALLLTALEGTGKNIAGYLSRPGEPGTRQLVNALVAAGYRVLLPVVSRADTPAWAWFNGWDDVALGWGGIAQPSGEKLGAAALAEVDLVLVPCLAAGLDGSRLGTGGGWYDRALSYRRDGVPVWALSREAEIFDAVPNAAHDLPVDAVITQSRWLQLPHQA